MQNIEGNVPRLQLPDSKAAHAFLNVPYATRKRTVRDAAILLRERHVIYRSFCPYHHLAVFSLPDTTRRKRIKIPPRISDVEPYTNGSGIYSQASPVEGFLELYTPPSQRTPSQVSDIKLRTLADNVAEFLLDLESNIGSDSEVIEAVHHTSRSSSAPAAELDSDLRTKDISDWGQKEIHSWISGA
ncbi:hypothetical protein C8R45DRAFT_923528 [Mycena sanguinolenta]|nr:hypothetical protein C8R45DRAFT_923528 [Mycena sanguinolenta]